MKYWITISLLILTSCGKPHNKMVAIAPEARPYVDSFEVESAKVGMPIVIDDLQVVFVHNYDNTETLGSCHQENNATPLINIDQQSWDWGTDAQHEQLVFHELGHCILHRVHDNRFLDINEITPISIMNAYEFTDDVYIANHTYYMHELFYGPSN